MSKKHLAYAFIILIAFLIFFLPIVFVKAQEPNIIGIDENGANLVDTTRTLNRDNSNDFDDFIQSLYAHSDSSNSTVDLWASFAEDEEKLVPLDYGENIVIESVSLYIESVSGGFLENVDINFIDHSSDNNVTGTWEVSFQSCNVPANTSGIITFSSSNCSSVAGSAGQALSTGEWTVPYLDIEVTAASLGNIDIGYISASSPWRGGAYIDRVPNPDEEVGDLWFQLEVQNLAQDLVQTIEIEVYDPIAYVKIIEPEENSEFGSVDIDIEIRHFEEYLNADSILISGTNLDTGETYFEERTMTDTECVNNCTLSYTETGFTDGMWRLQAMLVESGVVNYAYTLTGYTYFIRGSSDFEFPGTAQELPDRSFCDSPSGLLEEASCFIIQQLEKLVNFLFVPSQGIFTNAMQSIQENLQERIPFAFYFSIKNRVDSITETSESSPIDITVDLGGYLGEFTMINFSEVRTWINDFVEPIETPITYIAWLMASFWIFYRVIGVTEKA